MAKQSQHLNKTFPNIVGPTFASSGQMIATIELNKLLQHIDGCNMLR